MRDVDDDDVRVTLRTVYDAVTTLGTDINVVKENTALMTLRVATEALRTTDHEKRIRHLEKWMYAIPATFVTSLASVILAVRH